MTGTNNGDHGDPEKVEQGAFDELALRRKHNEQDVQIEQLAQQVLEASLDELSESTLARLKQAREAAMLQRHKSARNFGRKFGIGSGAIAATLTLFVLWQNPLSSQAPNLPQYLGETQVWQYDEELLDDLEFYAWLDQQDSDDLESSNAG